MTDSLPTPQQRRVAQAVITEEGSRRRHLVVHLSGAHAYGFPSRDSDLDLKAVHIDRSCDLLGLNPRNTTANRLELIEDVEIDYTSNELSTVVRGLLSGDGNMLERVMSAQPFYAEHSVLEGLRAVVPGALSKRYYRHYRGFSGNQRRRLLEGQPRVKRLLYVLRTTLTGAHLLREGVCEPNLVALAGRYCFDEVPELVALKLGAETGALEGKWLEQMDGLLEHAEQTLEHALELSSLPEEPTPQGREAIETWLVTLRRDNLESELG